MAISGDLRIAATLASYSKHPPRCSLPPSNSKVEFLGFLNGGCGTSRNMLKWSGGVFDSHKMHVHSSRSAGIAGEYQLSSTAINQEAESLLLSAINMSFFERFQLGLEDNIPFTNTEKELKCKDCQTAFEDDSLL
ncbi:hypothetical protein OIU78_005192 [Salix suchowensis]|nr:hypothetical protein OIU78_005192 [Salix suchowensis]